ncbi:hypothetical protein B4064_3845 [Caldibacillus thermoamylovorans]|nr:hypothetical protein B4064_3845 [Caldibacillus thermoamylovorans]
MPSDFFQSILLVVKGHLRLSMSNLFQFIIVFYHYSLLVLFLAKHR